MAITNEFFRDIYAGYDDYCQAIADVWGDGHANELYSAIKYAPELDPLGDPGRAWAKAVAMLDLMPEPDFRSAISISQAHAAYEPSFEKEERITRICRSRGAPWKFTLQGFVWTGDAQIEALAISPALDALGDQRFAGGVRADFESARRELALGTPVALAQSIHASGAAIESALKVVLTELGVAHDERGSAQKLYDTLKTAGHVEGYMERLLLAPATPRNRLGGHGAGAEPHDPPVQVAEAVLAAAAVCIAYLQKLLP